jgi:hypothetical protein
MKEDRTFSVVPYRTLVAMPFSKIYSIRVEMVLVGEISGAGLSSVLRTPPYLLVSTRRCQTSYSAVALNQSLKLACIDSK